MEEDAEVWTTDELDLAAFLVHRGHGCVRMDWKPPGDCHFVFLLDDDDVMNDVVDYTGNLATVNPKEFLRDFNKLKSEMISSRPKEMAPKRHRVRH